MNDGNSIDQKKNKSTRMKVALASLRRFILLLDENSYFNIVSFGKDHESLFSESVLATPANKHLCIRNIDLFEANMGGTELESCLRSVLSDNIEDHGIEMNCKDIKDSCPPKERVIILLTDGSVSAMDSLFDYCCQQNIRIFCLGIGDDVNRRCLKGLADHTNGLYTVVKDEMDLDNWLAYLLDAVNKQYYTNIRIESASGEQLRSSNDINSMKVIYPNQNYKFLLRCNDEEYQRYRAEGIIVRATNSITAEEVSWFRSLDVHDGKVEYSEMDGSTNDVLKLLYYSAVVEKLEHALLYNNLSNEETERLTASLLEISTNHNFLTSQTSFIIVDHSATEQELNQGGSEDVVVPHYHPRSNSKRMRTSDDDRQSTSTTKKLQLIKECNERAILERECYNRCELLHSSSFSPFLIEIQYKNIEYIASNHHKTYLSKLAHHMIHNNEMTIIANFTTIASSLNQDVNKLFEYVKQAFSSRNSTSSSASVVRLLHDEKVYIKGLVHYRAIMSIFRDIILPSCIATNN
jgi:hypothetical protein